MDYVQHTERVAEMIQQYQGRDTDGPSDNELHEFTDEGYVSPENDNISTHWD